VSDPVKEAIAAVADGRLIIVPTDTVYGIATRADSPEATGRLYEAKRRPRDAELPVFVSSVQEAERLAEFDDRASRLARAFWPGALTMILPRTVKSAGWDLGGDGTTIGLRIPAHPLARAVAAGAGPLAITSANKSGKPELESCDDLLRVFGDSVDVFLCEEEPIRGKASTVVEPAAGGGLKIVREGSIGLDALEKVVAEES
jgi:tRNA threonylcarbamoyl adenosine modification protein (Sua5/YciO/YrdC/YwlC family)